MKIQVQYINSHTVLNVRVVRGVLAGQAINFINSLHTSQNIAKAANLNKRVPQIGASV